MPRYLIPSFARGMVTKSQSKLDDTYREKAKDLTNFYNDNNSVLTRRPPLEKFSNSSFTQDELKSAVDLFDDGNGTEYLLKGETTEDTMLLNTSSYRIGNNERIPLTLSGTLTYTIPFGATLEIEGEDSRVLTEDVDIINRYSIDYISIRYKDSSGVSKRVFILKINVEITNNLLTLDPVSYTHFQALIETERGSGTFSVRGNHPNANELVKNDFKYKLLSASSFNSTVPLGLAPLAPSVASSINNITLRVYPVVQNTELPNEFLIIRDVPYISMFDSLMRLASTDDGGTLRTQHYASSVTRPEFFSPIVNDIPLEPVSQEIIWEALKIGVMIPNQLGDIPSTTAQRDLNSADINSIADGTLTLKEYSFLDRLESNDDTRIPYLDTIGGFDTVVNENSYRGIASAIAKNLRDKLKPVISLHAQSDNINEKKVSVFPDVKFKTSHNEAQSIFENLYENDDLDFWSLPSANIRSFIADLKSRKVKKDDGDDTMLERTIDDNPGIAVDQGTNSLYLNADDDNSTDSGYAYIPNTIDGRLPSNFGDLVEKQLKLEQLLTIPANDRSAEDKTLLDKLEDEIVASDSPYSKWLKSSWGFSKVPGTSSLFPVGVAPSRFSGIGAAGVCFSRKVTTADAKKKFILKNEITPLFPYLNVNRIIKRGTTKIFYRVLNGLSSLRFKIEKKTRLAVNVLNYTNREATTAVFDGYSESGPATNQQVSTTQNVVSLFDAYGFNSSNAYIRIYYDYSHPKLKKWYDGKNKLNLSVANSINSDEPEGFNNYIISRDRSPDKYTVKNTTSYVLADTTSNRIREGYSYTVDDTTGVTEERWARDFKLAMFNLPYHSTGNIISNPWYYGSIPPPLPGPTYNLVSGDIEDLQKPWKNITAEASGYGKPFLDIGYRDQLTTVDRLVPKNTEMSTRHYVDGLLSKMGVYSNHVSIMRTDIEPLTLDAPDRDVYCLTNGVSLSSHIINGEKQVTDLATNFWSVSHNFTPNDLWKRILQIPLFITNGRPPQAPQVLTLKENINSALVHQGNIILATDKQVLQITQASLGPNTFANTRRLLPRGITSNIVAEGTTFFGAQEDEIISFKYFETNGGYDGYNETREYKADIITQCETMIQRHNLALFVAGGTNTIHVLALGSDRRTNGFSRFTFPNVIHRIEKIDDNKILIFFDDLPPKLLDLSSRLNPSKVYLDHISDTQSDKFLSRVETLPVIDLSRPDFKSVKYTNISDAMLYLSSQITAFSLKIIGKEKTIEKQMNVNDILADVNPATENRPVLFEGLNLNTNLAPTVAIETDSSENLQFTSLLLELK